MDSFTSNNTAYIVMEFLEGETAKSRLEKNGLFSFEDAATLVVAILDVLEEVHKSGIIHRDIREGNILVDKTGIVKVIDFGIGKMFTKVENNEDSLVSKINRA
ncbi:MAG: protein kinase, partial [Oscillospiraceae bacterium]